MGWKMRRAHPRGHRNPVKFTRRNDTDDLRFAKICHLILEYEIPKYDGDLGAPKLYVPLNEEISTKKIRNLMTHFKPQLRNQRFTEQTFQALMRLRGIESNATCQHAEAFYCRKIVIG